MKNFLLGLSSSFVFAGATFASVGTSEVIVSEVSPWATLQIEGASAQTMFQFLNESLYVEKGIKRGTGITCVSPESTISKIYFCSISVKNDGTAEGDSIGSIDQ